MTLGERIAILRKNPDTCRVGKKWENAEYEELLTELHQDISIEEIAKKHQRPVSSIIYRLYVAGAILLYHGYTLSQTTQLTKAHPFALLKFAKNMVIHETIQMNPQVKNRLITFQF